MNPTYEKEAPDLLGRATGATDSREDCDEPLSLSSSVPSGVFDVNPQPRDPVVAAIRILARRGRQLREQAERAAAVHDQTEQRVETAGADQSNDQATQTADTMGKNVHHAFGLGTDVDSTDGRCCDGR